MSAAHHHIRVTEARAEHLRHAMDTVRGIEHKFLGSSAQLAVRENA